MRIKKQQIIIISVFLLCSLNSAFTLAYNSEPRLSSSKTYAMDAAVEELFTNTTSKVLNLTTSYGKKGFTELSIAGFSAISINITISNIKTWNYTKTLRNIYPTNCSLEINGTAISNVINGTGRWIKAWVTCDFNRLNFSITCSAYYNITCNVTNCVIQYGDTISVDCTETEDCHYFEYSIVEALNYFYSGFSSYRINVTIYEDWTDESVVKGSTDITDSCTITDELIVIPSEVAGNATYTIEARTINPEKCSTREEIEIETSEEANLILFFTAAFVVIAIVLYARQKALI